MYGSISRYKEFHVNMMENNNDHYECDDNVNDADDGDDDVDLEKNLISPGGKPVASGSVGADVGSVGMAALIAQPVLLHPSNQQSWATGTTTLIYWYCTSSHW